MGKPLALPLLLTGASLAALWGPCHLFPVQTLRTLVPSLIHQVEEMCHCSYWGFIPTWPYRQLANPKSCLLGWLPR